MARAGRRAADELGFAIVEGFTLTVGDAVLRPAFLLPQFGGERGMLVFADLGDLKPYKQAVVERGYGYSVISPSGRRQEFDPDLFAEVLADRGWSGPAWARPEWLPDPPEDDDDG